MSPWWVGFWILVLVFLCLLVAFSCSELRGRYEAKRHARLYYVAREQETRAKIRRIPK